MPNFHIHITNHTLQLSGTILAINQVLVPSLQRSSKIYKPFKFRTRMPRSCMILYTVNIDMGASTLEPAYVQIHTIHRHSTFCFACPNFTPLKPLQSAVNL